MKLRDVPTPIQLRCLQAFVDGARIVKDVAAYTDLPYYSTIQRIQALERHRWIARVGSDGNNIVFAITGKGERAIKWSLQHA